jgi:hypothetical protein
MDSGTWEDFTLELVAYLKPRYAKVVRCGGGGDMGRDVIGYKDVGWDNYQCKYYDGQLSVADAILEVGKILYYSYIGEYTLPDSYKFVSPHGAGVNLLKLFNDKTGAKWRQELFSRWDKICKDGITSKKSILMNASFEDYIRNKVDFSIFDEIPPIKLIELHKETPYHDIRFGLYYKKRPQPPKAPSAINWGQEQGYIDALLKAFSQHSKVEMKADNVGSYSNFATELSSARNNFFSADALDKFSQDWLPKTSFQELKDECYEAISATVNMTYPEGYTRYLKTSEVSVQINYTSHPLHFFMRTQDK